MQFNNITSSVCKTHHGTNLFRQLATYAT